MRLCVGSPRLVAASRHYLFGDAHVSSPLQYGVLVNCVPRSEDMYPWLSSMYTLEIDCEDPRWHSKRNGGPRLPFFHDFAGHLPNLCLLSLIGLDWAKSPLHPSMPAVVTRFPSLVELRLENCMFQSFDIFRRILVAIPTLAALTDGPLCYTMAFSPGCPAVGSPLTPELSHAHA